MFHDIFGHIPLFMDKWFSDFAFHMGRIGVRFIEHPEIIKNHENWRVD